MMEYILFVIGIWLLPKSADYLVRGSSSIAKKLGVSTFVIGLTIVAFGTSLPELIVNIVAAFKGSGDIAFGNIIGSNMSNTLLILGVMSLITCLKVKSSTTWKEIPFSFLAVLVLFILVLNSLMGKTGENFLSRQDGIILLLLFSVFLYYVFRSAKQDMVVKANAEIAAEACSYGTIVFMVLGGLIGLFFAGKWVVNGAVVIARTLNMSEFLISATVVAIGTSLPELTTSVVAASKKNVDLALGNIIGSNIFNILLVLGITAVIKPLKFPDSQFIFIDFGILLLATFLLFLFMFTMGKHKLDRPEGIMFLVLYACYIIFIIIRG